MIFLHHLWLWLFECGHEYGSFVVVSFLVEEATKLLGLWRFFQVLVIMWLVVPGPVNMSKTTPRWHLVDDVVSGFSVCPLLGHLP